MKQRLSAESPRAVRLPRLAALLAPLTTFAPLRCLAGETVLLAMLRGLRLAKAELSLAVARWLAAVPLAIPRRSLRSRLALLAKNSLPSARYARGSVAGVRRTALALSIRQDAG